MASSSTYADFIAKTLKEMSFLPYVPPPPARFILTLESANPAQQQLHQENLALKRILKESVPGSNSRAEAAERSLFEIRKSLVGLAIKVVPTRFANS